MTDQSPPTPVARDDLTRLVRTQNRWAIIVACVLFLVLLLWLCGVITADMIGMAFFYVVCLAALAMLCIVGVAALSL